VLKKLVFLHAVQGPGMSWKTHHKVLENHEMFCTNAEPRLSSMTFSGVEGRVAARETMQFFFRLVSMRTLVPYDQ